MSLKNSTDLQRRSIRLNTSPPVKERVFTEQAQQLLGVGRTFLMEKKANGEFLVGVHWVYSSGRPKSRILWDIPAIQQWQEDQSKKNFEAAEKAAADIETFAEMGVA